MSIQQLLWAMYRILQTSFCLFIPLLFAPSSQADSLTIETGDTLIASFGLTSYDSVCMVLGPCPDVPVGVEPIVYTAAPVNPASDYSLQAFLKSTNDNQEFYIGSLPLEITNFGSNTVGVFTASTNFPIPSDPSFWGPDPNTDTFQLIFQNSGDPFTLLYNPSLSFLTPEDAVGADVSSGTISVDEAPSNVTVSQVPEPANLSAITGM